MPPRDDVILFLDLETTGVDERLDNIIEIGMSLVSTQEGYPEISAFSLVVEPTDNAFLRMMQNDTVRNMHDANGLLDEIQQLRVGNIKRRSGMDADGYVPVGPSDADRAIQRWLREDTPVGRNTTHIPYGGSGVLHFDRRFIDRYLPRLSERITHWAYDVGVMRRAFTKFGVQPSDIEGKTHRALDDARVHAEEWRYYERVIGGLMRV